MVNFTLMTRIYEKTNSALAVSFLWIFYYLPAFFVGPFSGLVVDRFSKRKILIFTNIFQSLTMLLYLLMGESTYPIYSFVFLYSLLDEFYVPAETSSLPGLVKKQDLPVANSLFFASSQAALILGFSLSGLLMRVFGKSNIIILASVFLFLAGISVYYLPEKKEGVKKIKDFFSFWSELRYGYSYISENKIIMYPMIMSVTFSILLTVFGVSIPVIAKQLLNIKVGDAGPLLIIPVGLGALTAMSIVTKYSQKFRKKDFIKSGCLISFFALMIISIFMPFFNRATLPVTVILVYALGIAGILVFIPTQTLLQENIPQNLRGRIFGTLNFATTIITLPVLLLSATLIDSFGIRPFIFMAAFLMFLFLNLFKKVEVSVFS